MSIDPTTQAAIDAAVTPLPGPMADVDSPGTVPTAMQYEHGYRTKLMEDAAATGIHTWQAEINTATSLLICRLYEGDDNATRDAALALAARAAQLVEAKSP